MVPTRDHKIILHWALTHDATPAEISPLKFDGQPAVLSFLMGDAKTGTPEIRPISWESFFAQFDLLELSFAFDQQSKQFNLVRVDKSPEVSVLTD